MLLAADVALPRQVWVHGYVQWGGAKMSKTAGTAVSLDGAIERHGADALRYFLLREIGFESDGNFSWERFDARYTADLADTVGNLASRVLAMVQRYRNGTVPHDASGYATPLEADARRSLETYARDMDALALEGGAAELVSLAARANRYVEESAPWTLAKSGDPTALDTVLANLTRSVARISVLASPFMPEKAEQLWNTLGSGRRLAEVRFSDVIDLDPAGWAVEKLPPLFPKP